MQGLISEGMPGKEAMQAMVERQREQVAVGEAPSADAQIQEMLWELCELYPEADVGEQAEVRERLKVLRYVRGRLYGLVHSAAKRLRESRDRRWLDLGLTAAALEGGRIDFRDLYVALGELWLAAEKVRINPRKPFRAAAETAGEERDSFGRSGRSLIAGFEKSAHLHSIRKRR